MCSAVSRCHYYVMTMVVVHIEDIHCGVKKMIYALPDEVQQEAVRIMKGSCKSNNNLTGVKKRSVWPWKPVSSLPSLLLRMAVLPLYSVPQNFKITALLEEKAYRKLKKVPAEHKEHKTILPLKTSIFSEEVCQELQP